MPAGARRTAGIGKSRLADEVLKSLAHRATPLVGGCPSYGQGMTLWPLREMFVHSANGQLRVRGLAISFASSADGVIDGRLDSAALGLKNRSGLRKKPRGRLPACSTLAHARPHLVVLEDAHWADSKPPGPDRVRVTPRHGCATGHPVHWTPRAPRTRPAWAELCMHLPPLSTEETQALPGQPATWGEPVP